MCDFYLFFEYIIIVIYNIYDIKLHFQCIGTLIDNPRPPYYKSYKQWSKKRNDLQLNYSCVKTL